MRIEYHRTLLADRIRNTAFHEALRRVIKPGETTVADIGAGTGFLGFLASKLGAKRVDLYETADIAAVARKLLRHNRLNRVRIAEIHSTEVATPEPVDVIVSETLGNYPFEENIVETLNDARERFLRPGGIVIPSAVEQFVCPVVSDRFYRDLTVWDGIGYGLDFTPAKTMTLNNIYVRVFAKSDLLDVGEAARSWDKLTFNQRNRTTRTGEVTWTAQKSTTIYGLALWWSAELVPGVSLATGPLSPATHWEQLYLPVLKPIALDAKHTLGIRLRSTTSYDAGTNLTWNLRALDAKGRELDRQSLDLAKGYLP